MRPGNNHNENLAHAGNDLTAARIRRAFAGHPPGLAALFFTELWERFSYYGMRALLVIFITTPVNAGGLGFATLQAAVLYGNYTMAVYMLSIPGGALADAWLGARRAVIVGGTMIATGHFALAIQSETAFYAGLVLIALGTGLFKPSISALVGDLYAPGDTRRDAGFSIFYMGINIGGLAAPLVTGFLAQSETVRTWLAAHGIDPSVSWHLGFAAAGVGMVIGLGSLVLGWKYLAKPGPLPSPDRDVGKARVPLAFLAAIVIGAYALLSDQDGLTWLRWGYLLAPLAAVIFLARGETAEHHRFAAVFVFFIAAMIFFAVFEQAGVTIALFAEKLTRSEVFGFSFPSAWFQSLNSLFVILLAPLFAGLWTRLGDRQPSSPTKFAMGLAFLALSYLLLVPAASMTAEGRVSPVWLIALFFLQTMGELCLSPVGLSTMTKLAPASMTSLVLGIWFLAAAFGNKLAGVLGGEFQSTDATALSHYFLWQGAVVAAAALALLTLAPSVKRLMKGVH